MVTINKLEIENVKRVKGGQDRAVSERADNCQGNNNQGKTSVLDAIAWALGGNKYKPSQAQREGSTIPQVLKSRYQMALLLSAKGKNSDLRLSIQAETRPARNCLIASSKSSLLIFQSLWK